MSPTPSGNAVPDAETPSGGSSSDNTPSGGSSGGSPIVWPDGIEGLANQQADAAKQLKVIQDGLREISNLPYVPRGGVIDGDVTGPFGAYLEKFQEKTAKLVEMTGNAIGQTGVTTRRTDGEHISAESGNTDLAKFNGGPARGA
jgi:hypothetical protein